MTVIPVHIQYIFNYYIHLVFFYLSKGFLKKKLFPTPHNISLDSIMYFVFCITGAMFQFMKIFSMCKLCVNAQLCSSMFLYAEYAHIPAMSSHIAAIQHIWIMTIYTFI